MKSKRMIGFCAAATVVAAGVFGAVSGQAETTAAKADAPSNDMASSEESDQTPVETDEAASNEVRLMNQAKGIDTYFAIQGQINASPDTYHDTYGGMYLDEEGNLNILVVNNQQKTSAQSTDQTEPTQAQVMDGYKALIDKYAEENQDVIIREVDYSFGQLENIQNALMEKANELGIVDSAIMEKENILQVGYLEDDPTFDKDKIVQLVGDSNCLEFVVVSYAQESVLVEEEKEEDM